MKFTPSGGRVTLVAAHRPGRPPDGAVTADRAPRRRARRPAGGAATPASASPTGEQGKLFTRFFRASTAQRNAVPGVGLGLAITKAITTAHGGTLDLVSAEGEGTTFTLTLPAPHDTAARCRPL